MPFDPNSISTLLESLRSSGFPAGGAFFVYAVVMTHFTAFEDHRWMAALGLSIMTYWTLLFIIRSLPKVFK